MYACMQEQGKYYMLKTRRGTEYSNSTTPNLTYGQGEFNKDDNYVVHLVLLGVSDGQEYLQRVGTQSVR